MFYGIRLADYAVLIVVMFFVVGFLVLYLPSKLFLYWYLKRQNRINIYKNQLTKAGIVLILLPLPIFSIGVLGMIQDIAPPTNPLATVIQAVGGKVVFAIVLIALVCLLMVVPEWLGLRLEVPPEPQFHDPDPVLHWTPIVKDKGLRPESAYAVEFQNDNKTHMAFVLSMFVNCFGMKINDAYQEAMAIHEQGSRIVGSMSQKNAEALVEHIRAESARRDFPFQCKAVPVMQRPDT